jgi:hypothetical protein
VTKRYGSLGLWIFLILTAALTVLGARAYNGTRLLYIIFSIICNAQLVLSLRRQKTYSYPILSILFWLGFWLKITLHIIINYPYQEPVGFFDYSSNMYDKVIIIIICIIAALFASGELTFYIIKKSTTCIDMQVSTLKHESVFLWLKILPAILAIMIGIISILNLSIGIQQAGLITRTRLPFYLGTLVSWLLSVGFILSIATLIFWDTEREKRWLWYIALTLFEGFMSSVSLMSRAIFIFHVGPVFLALFIKDGFALRTKLRRTIGVGCVSLLIFMGSIVTVTSLREFYYNGDRNWPSAVGGLFHNENQNVPSVHIAGTLATLSRLVVDRWIGAEGVMAVSSYPNKGMELLKEGMLERRKEGGQADLYQTICLSNYRFSDTTKYIFGSLPGVGAFFFYSGSHVVVFIGIFILCMFAFISEVLIARAIGNPLILIWYAFYISMQVDQTGIDPYRESIAVGMTFVGLAFLWAVQKWLRRYSTKPIAHGVSA